MDKQEKKIFNIMTDLGFDCHDTQIKDIAHCYTKGREKIFSDTIEQIIKASLETNNTSKENGK